MAFVALCIYTYDSAQVKVEHSYRDGGWMCIVKAEKIVSGAGFGGVAQTYEIVTHRAPK